MPKKATKRTENDDALTSDTDSEMLMNPTCMQASSVQEGMNTHVIALNNFLTHHEFAKPTGSPDTNIVDRGRKDGCYHIDADNISTFFRLYRRCQKSGADLCICEKQLENSGIMLDFDIYQNDAVSQLTVGNFSAMALQVVGVLHDILVVAKDDKIIVAVTKKPHPKSEKERGCYKDGFHLLIPGVQVTRAFKTYLIQNIIDKKVVETVLHMVKPHESNTRGDFLDRNSKHVMTHFYGSRTKPGARPYILAGVFSVYFDEVSTRLEVKEITPDFMKHNTNLAYELSLNWERRSDQRCIKKQIYVPKDPDAVAKYVTHAPEEPITNISNEREKYVDLIKIVGDTVPQQDYATAELIRLLLDTLSVERCSDFKSWFEVLCVLSNTGPQYKELARYFSRKSDKYQDDIFERKWAETLRPTSKKLSMGSLHFWARTDNPVAYNTISRITVYGYIHEHIFDAITEGFLGHYTIASILHRMLRYKYVVSREKAGDAPQWFEFVTPDVPHEKGEVFKWRKYPPTITAPTSLSCYMSEILPEVMRKSLMELRQLWDRAEENKSKYYGKLYNNFRKTCASLSNHAVKAQIFKEAMTIFEDLQFARELDKDPNLLGVGNGVLLLKRNGQPPELIQGYHNYKISRYTPVDYIPFNPRDPLTKTVLKAMRDLHPDDAHDAFEFMIYYDSSTLDGHKKGSVFHIVFGSGSNGKTVRCELLKGVLGDYVSKLPISFLTSMGGSHEAATPTMMLLKDARLVYAGESNRSEILNSARIKEVTGMETIAGRELFKSTVNFKPICHVMVSSNYDFEIRDNTHGMWRRIKYMNMKMTFKLPHEKRNPDNKYERVANPDISGKWVEDPKVLSAYLSILTYYYMKLQKKYGGYVTEVPHPTVYAATENFRIKQDFISRFISERMVKTVGEDDLTDMAEVSERFIKWYTARIGDPKGTIRSSTMDLLQNSRMQPYIQKNDLGVTSLKGYRILDAGEEPHEGEEYFMRTKQGKERELAVLNAEVKTFDQYYEELLKEFDELSVSRDLLDEKEEADAIAKINNANMFADDLPPETETLKRLYRVGSPAPEREDNIPLEDIIEYQENAKKIVLKKESAVEQLEASADAEAEAEAEADDADVDENSGIDTEEEEANDAAEMEDIAEANEIAKQLAEASADDIEYEDD